MVGVIGIQPRTKNGGRCGGNYCVLTFRLLSVVRRKLETSFPTANAAVKILEDLGIVTEMTGLKKNRSYSCQAYIELLSR